MEKPVRITTVCSIREPGKSPPDGIIHAVTDAKGKTREVFLPWDEGKINPELAQYIESRTGKTFESIKFYPKEEEEKARVSPELIILLAEHQRNYELECHQAFSPKVK